MSLIKKIRLYKKKDTIIDRKETHDKMTQSNFEAMKARLRERLQKDKTDKEVKTETEPAAEVKEVKEEVKPSVKLNVSSLKAKLLAKSIAGTKVVPKEETAEDTKEAEKKTSVKESEETKTAKEAEGKKVAEKTEETKTEEPAVEENSETDAENISEDKPATKENKVAEDDEAEKKESKKTTRKTATRRRKVKKAADDSDEEEINNTIEESYDYATMSQVIAEHYTSSDFEEMIDDFSKRIKDVRIESDMNLGVFKVAQAELVNLRDEVALEHFKCAYTTEATGAMVKQITDKNIGIGASVDERKANVAKALATAVVDGVSVDVAFCYSVAKLREQSIAHLLERIDAKLKACITMSAVLKMEQSI